jgi:autotransporter-associated beta strand protein
MKPSAAIRSFLALTGSSLLAISSSHAQTVLANSYLTTLDVTSPLTLYPAGGFASFMVGPLTGSSDLTIAGGYTGTTNVNGTVSLTNNGSGNTFSGNIVVNSGTLRIAGSPFASNGGFTAPSMGSGSTITINRAGILTIDDNVTGGYTANRFGSAGNRPTVNLAGGTINLTGRNNATSSVQTFGALSSSGQGTLNVTRSNGTPTLTFASLAISSGSLLSFNDNNTSILGSAATNVPQITFTSAPSNTNGILAGARFYSGSPGTSEFVTYGANGVTRFTAYDVSSNNINGATSTQNVRLNGATAPADNPVALSGDTTINSLTYAGLANWSLGGFKLTIGSGMLLRNGNNSDPNITNGTLTAGNGIDDIDLNIIVAQNNMTIGAVIADNSATAVTLVKSGDARSLTLNGGTDNTYTGGTSVVGGTLSTGTTANRRYLGTGKVTVDGESVLSLGAIGATSFSGSLGTPTYTATNGGKIQIYNAAPAVTEFYNIGANSIIAASGGTAGAGVGLAGLTRGTNITLAAGAIIGHPNRASALNLSAGTIQNIGTTADLFYGLNANQSNSAGQLNIGTGTAFRGISTDRSDRSWEQGTIDILSGTTSVEFQGHAGLANAVQLTLGNGTTAGNPVINFAGTGTVDINAIGRLNLNDDLAVYGNTGASKNIRFVATPGSILLVNQATGMGSGANGVASALVQNGGILAIGNAAALNGAVTVQAGGQFNASQAGGLTGTGALTFNEGSIVLISNALGFSGTQATSATINPGTLVRAAIATFGGTSDTTTLDYILGSGTKHVSYITQGNDAANPTSGTIPTAVYTLNKSSLGIGGVLTNDQAVNRTITNLTNGHIALGANGGVLAATTNSTLTISENITGAGSLTIGTTAILDGMPKLGTVLLSNSANDYSGTTFINAGTLQSNNAIPNASLVSLTNAAGVTFQLTGSDTIGNLTGGALSTVVLGTQTLTLGDSTDQTFAGTFSGATNGNLVKQGTGVFEMSGTNALTGSTTINNGLVKISGSSSLSTGNLNLAGGILGLANGNFNRANGTGAGQVQFTGPLSGSGFAAFGGTRTVSFGGGSKNWNDASFIGAGRTLILGHSTADGTVDVTQNISFAGSQRTVQVNNGSAAIDARLSGTLAGGTTSGLEKTGAGTLEITGTNTYTGSTTVSAGTLRLGASNVLFDTTEVASVVTIAAATLDVAAGVTDSTGVAPLDVSAAATINLGNNLSQIAFADSSGVDWTGGSLNITGAFVSGSSIKFATSGGLTGAQLGNITLNGAPTSFSLDGSGFLVSGGGPVGFAAWQLANGTAGGRDQDHDGDGVDNGTEHFIYGTVANSGFTALPTVNMVGGLSVTWTKAGTYTGGYGTGYVVETSTTLSGPWATEPNPGLTISFPSANEVKYTFPGGPAYTGKRFARLKVTGP